MLPTNEKAAITMSLMNILIFGGSHPENNQYKNTHLYILSDEEIKEGDWYLTFQNNEVIGGARKCEDSSYNFTNCKKIIATTDKSLKISIDGNRGNLLPDVSFDIVLPQPPQQFIEYFVFEYNKGNIITEVMVEYNNDGKYFCGIKEQELKKPTLKINPDNTINIKPIKDSWSREEIIDDIEQAMIDGLTLAEYRDKWID